MATVGLQRRAIPWRKQNFPWFYSLLGNYFLSSEVLSRFNKLMQCFHRKKILTSSHSVFFVFGVERELFCSHVDLG